jgi:hypothetical protein
MRSEALLKFQECLYRSADQPTQLYNAQDLSQCQSALDGTRAGNP